jgi:hypothetical protein
LVDDIETARAVGNTVPRDQHPLRPRVVPGVPSVRVEADAVARPPSQCVVAQSDAIPAVDIQRPLSEHNLHIGDLDVAVVGCGHNAKQVGKEMHWLGRVAGLVVYLRTMARSADIRAKDIGGPRGAVDSTGSIAETSLEPSEIADLCRVRCGSKAEAGRGQLPSSVIFAPGVPENPVGKSNGPEPRPQTKSVSPGAMKAHLTWSMAIHAVA